MFDRHCLAWCRAPGARIVRHSARTGSVVTCAGEGAYRCNCHNETTPLAYQNVTKSIILWPCVALYGHGKYPYPVLTKHEAWGIKCVVDQTTANSRVPSQCLANHASVSTCSGLGSSECCHYVHASWKRQVVVPCSGKPGQEQRRVLNQAGAERDWVTRQGGCDERAPAEGEARALRRSAEGRLRQRCSQVALVVLPLYVAQVASMQTTAFVISLQLPYYNAPEALRYRVGKVGARKEPSPRLKSNIRDVSLFGVTE